MAFANSVLQVQSVQLLQLVQLHAQAQVPNNTHQPDRQHVSNAPLVTDVLQFHQAQLPAHQGNTLSLDRRFVRLAPQVRNAPQQMQVLYPAVAREVSSIPLQDRLSAINAQLDTGALQLRQLLSHALQATMLSWVLAAALNAPQDLSVQTLPRVQSLVVLPPLQSILQLEQPLAIFAQLERNVPQHQELPPLVRQELTQLLVEALASPALMASAVQIQPFPLRLAN